MQSWLQWLIYILAGWGAIVVIGIIGAFIYWVVTIIRDKIEDYNGKEVIFEQLKNAGFEVVDMTCLDVKKVQQKAIELAKNDYFAQKHFESFLHLAVF